MTPFSFGRFAAIAVLAIAILTIAALTVAAPDAGTHMAFGKIGIGDGWWH